MRDNLFSVAKGNIDDAQLKQKRDYDKKHGVHNKKVVIYTWHDIIVLLMQMHVCVCDCHGWGMHR